MAPAISVRQLMVTFGGRWRRPTRGRRAAADAGVLKVASEKKLLKGKALGINATTLEANAAMKSIVRRDGAATLKAYLTKLAKGVGIEDHTDDQLRQFARTRKGKKTSNSEWESRGSGRHA